MDWYPDKQMCCPISGQWWPMRAPFSEPTLPHDPNRRREFVLASSRLTHRGWQAEIAALAVAESVAMTIMNHVQPDSSEVPVLFRLSPETEWKKLLTAIELSLNTQHSVSEFAWGLGLKKAVSGYSLHVVPVALYAWLRHPGDFRAALISVLNVAVIPTPPEPSWGHWPGSAVAGTRFLLNGSTPYGNGHVRVLSWNRLRDAWQNRNHLDKHTAQFVFVGPDSSFGTSCSSQSSWSTGFVVAPALLTTQPALISNIVSGRGNVLPGPNESNLSTWFAGGVARPDTTDLLAL